VRIGTNATIHARIGSTLIDVQFAESARIARRASTRKAVQRIDTGSTVAARIRLAFIDVRLANRS
jgi:hypothetical protein